MVDSLRKNWYAFMFPTKGGKSVGELIGLLLLVLLGRLGWRLFKGAFRLGWWLFTTFVGAVAILLVLAVLGGRC